MHRFRLGSYSVAVGVVTLSVLLKLLIEHFIPLKNSFLLFFPAVIISAWYGNVLTGLLSAALAVLVICYQVVDPTFSLLNLGFGQSLRVDLEQSFQWLLEPEQDLWMGLFLLESSALSAILGRLPFPGSVSESNQTQDSEAQNPELLQAYKVLEQQVEAQTANLTRNLNLRQQIEEERNQLLMREQAVRAVVEMAERQSAFLAAASKALAASLNYEATLSSLVQLVVPFLADYCLIFRLEEDGELKQVSGLHRDPQKQELISELAQLCQTHIREPESLIAQAVRTKEPLNVSEPSYALAQSTPQNRQLWEIHRELNLRSCLVVPLIARGQVLGAIQLVMSAESERCYEPADLLLAEDLACRAAIALDNAYLYSQAQEINRLKDEFLATLSHELRTPLNAMMGWAQLLQSREFDEATNHAIATIERNARMQAQVIKDLLDMSRIITGRLRLKPRWTSPSAIINVAIDALGLAAEAKSICLEMSLDASACPLWVDPKCMRQVVWNLLSNAIKFTPRGGQVKIQLTREADYALVQVSDTGQGINPEFLPYVFDRFRQADGSTTRPHGGLGLGLAIVRHLVELHGGSVKAESPGEGQGATFTIKLPLMGENCDIKLK